VELNKKFTPLISSGIIFFFKKAVEGLSYNSDEHKGVQNSFIFFQIFLFYAMIFLK